MKSQAFGAIALAIFTAYANAASPSRQLEVEVDCANGESIGEALDRPVFFERRIVVTVRGTCAENVLIERDDVTLRAHASGGGIDAPDATRPAILVNGARRTSIEGLSMRGGLHGVRSIQTAAASVRNGTIRGAAEDGIRAENNSSIVVDDSLVEGNGQSGISARGAHLTLRRSSVRGNGISGVVVNRGGQAQLGGTDGGEVCCGNTIEGHPVDGLTVADNAGATLFGNTIQNNGFGSGPNTGRFGILIINTSAVRLFGGNVIRNNGGATQQIGGAGILLRGATLRTGPGDTPLSPTTNEVSGNAFGIQALDNSVLDLRGGLGVSGNKFNGVTVLSGSRMRTEGSTVANNGFGQPGFGFHGIVASRASSVELVNANSVTGNGGFGLFCNDAESSHVGNIAGITGNVFGQVSCTGF